MSLTHSPVRAVGGMAASAHPLASAAGAEMLRNGGNAFDAVIAITATLNVVEPFMSGLAGQGGATVWSAADQRMRCLDFITPVPKLFDSAGLEREAVNTGPMASGAPGNLAGWCTMLDTYGTMSLAEVLAPAIRHARDGFPVSALYAAMATDTKKRAVTPEWAKVYLPVDGECTSGWILLQPRLADTLEAIASEGARHLHGGALGQAMVDHIAELGGCLSMEDLEAVKPAWQVPFAAGYRDLLVYTTPPPAESFQFPLTLRILDGFDLGEMDHVGVDHLDTVLRAIRVAAEKRINNNNRPVVDIEALLAEENVEPMRRRVRDPEPITARTEQFGDPLPPHVAEGRSHTTSVSVADKHGNMVCLTQSHGSPWGSTVVIPDTGVCMNNFLNWGDLNPASPNRLLGGKRWAMCLTPSISTRNGQPVLALGTPGSYGIMQTQTQAMVHYLDFGLNLRQAIEAPRARLFDGRRVVLEERVASSVVEALRGRGHEIEPGGPYTMQCGGMQAVSRDPATGALAGTADPRRDGVAVGV
ncbi:MAG: gamma-glutamyltranspeptidase [Rhodospirillaceae bacterium]|nr:gamma-glutamyltranspeptidase [Rhodospirillaceae bacterium]